MNGSNLVLRGVVIQVPGAGPGIILAEGKQWPFKVEGLWNAAVAPAANQAVELSINESKDVVGINVVDQQTIAKERLEQFANVAGSQGQQFAVVAKQKLGVLIAKMGTPVFVASVALWIAWFFLPALHVSVGFGSADLTFSDVLSYTVGNPNRGASFGFIGFLGLAAITGPWVSPWLTQRWAYLLNAAPLGFVGLAIARIKWELHSAANQAIDGAQALGGVQGQQFANQLVKGLSEQISKAISFGWGLWVVVLASVVLAAVGVLRFRNQESRRAFAQ